MWWNAPDRDNRVGLRGMRVWIVASFACLLALGLVSCEPKYDNFPEMIKVRECGRVWHISADSERDFRRAVRSDCYFLRPQPERTDYSPNSA
jgi:hypothetical protein